MNTLSSVTMASVRNNGVASALLVTLLLTSQNGLFNAISPSGQSVVVANGANIFVSTNYGSSFTNTGTCPTNPFIIRISDSGQYILATNYYDTVVYLSTDSGSTWSTPPVNASNRTFGEYSLSISGSGQYMLAIGTGSNGAVFVNNNYGAVGSWVNALPMDTLGGTMSATGQYMVTLTNPPYYSSNYGVSFTAFAANAAFTNPGRIYLSGNGTMILGTYNLGGTRVVWYTLDGGSTIVLTDPGGRLSTNNLVHLSSTGSPAFVYDSTNKIIYKSTDRFQTTSVYISAINNTNPRFTGSTSNDKYLVTTNTSVQLITNTAL